MNMETIKVFGIASLGTGFVLLTVGAASMNGGLTMPGIGMNPSLAITAFVVVLAMGLFAFTKTKKIN